MSKVKIEAELEKAAMAFQLKDGSILWISKEDVNEIANKIIFEGLIDGKVQLSFNKDNNISKARELHDMLTREKGMPPELRVQYYEEILRLYKQSGQDFTDVP